MNKPVLVGEANPYGGDPKFALFPSPEGCSGYRLCHLILGMRRMDYMREFERVNLCPHKWLLREARARTVELHGKQLILLGSKVCKAFDVPFAPFESQYPSTEDGGGSVLILPHPSGLSRAWNEPGAIDRARRLVTEFIPEIKHLIGVA